MKDAHHQRIDAADYASVLAQPALAEDYASAGGCRYLLVEGAAGADLPAATLLPQCPVVAIGVPAQSAAFDLVAHDESQFEVLEYALQNQPLACATLVQLLRHNERANAIDGLFAESLAYSTLQQSAGFQAWLKSGGRRAAKPDREPVLIVEREGSRLELTLNRPQARNAYSTALKDALCAGLQVAHADLDIEEVSLRGNGPAFCAGGDLSEFGQVTDAAEAHLSRTSRSAGALIASLPCTSQAHLQGACVGAGIEIPAFADGISAAPDTFFQLPEVSMGLVPGAGGTVSITRRIGRQWTAYMAISGLRIDAPTALGWGLIDRITS